MKRIRRRAFTIIELLVVIGIIAVLISILLPAIHMAQRASKSSVCLSNLRQVGNAMQMYATANREYVLFQAAGGSEVYQGNTYTATLDFHAKRLSNGVQPDVWDLSNGLWSRYGLTGMAGYCPELGDLEAASWGSVQANGGSAQSSNQGFNGYGINSNLQGGFNISQLYHNSADEVAIADGLQWSGSYFTTVPFPIFLPRTSTGAANQPDFSGRHGGVRGGVLWVDGHATMELCILPPTTFTITSTTPVKTTDYIKRKIGYLVRSLSDLQSSDPNVSNRLFNGN